MEIQKMLVLSTSHLRAVTEKAMRFGDAPFLYDKKNGGYIIPFIDQAQIDTLRGDGYYDVADVLAYADKRGCTWVMFDCDANLIDDGSLNIFDW